MRISVVWSMLRYIASSKINKNPLTYTKHDFSIIVEKMENWIGRTVHGPPFLKPMQACSIPFSKIFVQFKKLFNDLGYFQTGITVLRLKDAEEKRLFRANSLRKVKHPISHLKLNCKKSLS